MAFARSILATELDAVRDRTDEVADERAGEELEAYMKVARDVYRNHPFYERAEQAAKLRRGQKDIFDSVAVSRGEPSMKPILLCILALGVTAVTISAQKQDDSETVIAMERKAMDAWGIGNPDEFLSISDPEITFFHSAVTEKRVEGLSALKELYGTYRGRPLFDSYDLRDPKVQVYRATAILTYRLVTRNGSLVREWDATEVYQRKEAGWRIVHTHFSAAKQPAA